MTEPTPNESSREDRILVTRGHLEVLVRHALFRGQWERDNAMFDSRIEADRIVSEFLTEIGGNAAGS